MPNFTDAEKIAVLEDVIVRARRERRYGGDRHEWEVLRSIAAEIRGRSPERRVETLERLDARIESVQRSHGAFDCFAGLGQEVFGRWPTVRRALALHAAAKIGESVQSEQQL